MAGGTFDKTIGKVRPGTYLNFESTRQDLVAGSERGTVIIPLAKTTYGPAKQFITITAGSPDAEKAKLGFSVYSESDDNALLIREALKGASTIILYICAEGAAASTGAGGGLKATAKYKGSKGDNLEYSVVDNPLGGFDVNVFLDDNKVELFEGITSVEALADSKYITFAASTTGDTPYALAAIAGVKLTGGADAAVTNEDIVSFLDAAEGIAWNTMAFPFEEATLHAALKTKIKYLRENVGKGVQAAAANFKADYEGIINVTNSYAIGDKELTTAQATAYVAGITAGATNIQSNTYKAVDGAVKVVGVKTHEQAVEAIKKGEFFFSISEAGNVVVEYDINSLTTFKKPKDKTYAKNRVIRVFDTFQEVIQLNFPPNKFDNDPDGWDIMEGIGKSILKMYGPRSDGGSGAIKNINYGVDFLVDRTRSSADETYFNVGLEPVDSAEKLYFTVSTR